jgi:AraC family transcriptional regulator
MVLSFTAGEATMRGTSLIDGVHAAGFADSAHVSRTFRSTFGIARPFMFERSCLSVTFCEIAVGTRPLQQERASPITAEVE